MTTFIHKTNIGSSEQREQLESRFQEHALVYSKDWTVCYVSEVKFTDFGFEYKLQQKRGGKLFRNGEWQREEDVYSYY